MKFKLVIPARPGKPWSSDPLSPDYWPDVVKARTEWGDPVADAGTPYFLRDILVSHVLRVHNWNVHPLLLRLSPITREDIERDAARVDVRQGEILAARMGPGLPPVVFKGLRELLACAYLGQEPKVSEIEPPKDLALDILKDRAPEKVPDAFRAAAAVVTFDYMHPEARKRSNQNLRRGKNPPERPERSPGHHSEKEKEKEGRTTERIAKIAGLDPKTIKKTRTIQLRSSVALEAMLSMRIRSVTLAKRVVDEGQLETEDERAEALEVLIANQSKPGHIGLLAFKAFLRRLYARKHPLAEPLENPKRFEIILGDCREIFKTKTLKRDHFDRAFFDPMWGSPGLADLCDAVAQECAHVLKPGGILCALIGMGTHGKDDQIECALRMKHHLRYLGTGSLRMLKAQDNNLSWLTNMEAMTLWFFSRGEPTVVLGNEATSPRPDTKYDINQRNLDGMLELFRKLQVGPAMSVLDPTCCTGTTGVAALKLGARFTGVELDDERVEIARRRCSEAEREAEDAKALGHRLALEERGHRILRGFRRHPTEVRLRVCDAPQDGPELKIGLGGVVQLTSRVFVELGCFDAPRLLFGLTIRGFGHILSRDASGPFGFERQPCGGRSRGSP
jgi:hypothetical protein